MNNSRDIRYKFLICLLLTAAILFAYGQVQNSDFILFDDPLYVTDNPHVQKGLTATGLIWAFTSFSASNWHPVTWLSHMLDCEIFGLNPTGHHWTNLLLHIANTFLLFIILFQMTQAFWQSAFAAALFALHPLHVESVAWVAERKDVLSTFFGMLTILLYYRYVKKSHGMKYLLVVLFFSLGLMAKPMLVTLPFVLLLLDYWPLKRFQYNAAQTNGIAFQGSFGLIWEKIPLFVLVAITCLLTLTAHESRGAFGSLEAFSMKARISNAVVSYVSYIVKTIWPQNLSVFYPHPSSTLPTWQPIGAAFLIAGACFLAIRKLKQYPYIAVGLFWYLGTLVPVIGLIQVGEQAMADRYTYIPLTGLFIIVAWGAPDLLRKYHSRKRILWVSAAIILATLTVRTFFQVSHWKNSITLFKHAIRVTENNSAAHTNLGLALFNAGKIEEAIFHYKKALIINPEDVVVLYNLGTAQLYYGRIDAAVLSYTNALGAYNEGADPHHHLAYVIDSTQKRLDQIFKYHKDWSYMNVEDLKKHLDSFPGPARKQSSINRNKNIEPTR